MSLSDDSESTTPQPDDDRHFSQLPDISISKSNGTKWNVDIDMDPKEYLIIAVILSVLAGLSLRLGLI